MIQRNAQSANESTEVSSKSQAAVARGKKTVEEMIDSINDISQSNDEIAKEFEKNNQDISKIVQVISEIGEKTKVINDIVFQTKLLSFNASVEAARAGEHGKGFAVVAEEVGNLATMSGKAALEITTMLDESIKQVTEIVEETTKKVEKLVVSSKDKVKRGTETAKDCENALDEILTNVSSVNSRVKEIAIASQEQSVGVKEVNEAMQMLDQSTHKNSMIADDSLGMANDLRDQAGSLNKAVKELIFVVSGNTSQSFNLDLPDKESIVLDLESKPKYNKKSQSNKKAS